MNDSAMPRTSDAISYRYDPRGQLTESVTRVVSAARVRRYWNSVAPGVQIYVSSGIYTRVLNSAGGHHTGFPIIAVGNQIAEYAAISSNGFSIPRAAQIIQICAAFKACFWRTG
jgi:hypothetical protein